MHSGITKLVNAEGWKRYLLLYFLGAASVLALPPFYFPPILLITIPLFLMVLDKAAKAGESALWAWLFGYGYFVAGCYWISISLFTDIARFWWLLPFSLIGLNAIFGLFFALLGWGYYRFRHASRLVDAATFVILWALIEFLRTYLFTGFPWNLIGYSVGATTITAQSVSLFGSHVAGIWVLLLALVPYVWRHAQGKKYALVVSVFTGALLAYGVWHQQAPLKPREKDVQLRIVQASIPQEIKWDPDHRMSTLQRHLDLSLQPSNGKLDAIIWPETALPFTLLPSSEWPGAIALALNLKAPLITGAITGIGSRTVEQAWNSMVVIGSGGQTWARYDKHHLVPFGEYVPLRRFLPLNKITSGTLDFSAGPAPNPLEFAGLPPLLPLICYEIIFSDYINKQAANADWALNITNDGWYGYSTGPFQHAQMARFRAIEAGIPVVRAANSGISVVYDALGNTVAQLGLGKTGALDVVLPQKLASSTIYSRYRNAIFLLTVGIFMLFRHYLKRFQ